MKTFVATMTGVLLTIAGARSGFATETFHSVFRGTNALATFLEEAPIPCEDGTTASLSTFVRVTAFTNVSFSTGTQDFSQATAVQVSTFDGCTGAFTFGTGVIANPDYTQHNITSAHLAGTATVFDDFTGELIGTVALNLTWSAVGPIHNAQTHNQFTFGSVHVVSNSGGAFRDATLSGVATFNGVNLLPSAQTVTLFNSKSGSTVVIRD